MRADLLALVPLSVNVAHPVTDAVPLIGREQARHLAITEQAAHPLQENLLLDLKTQEYGLYRRRSSIEAQLGAKIFALFIKISLFEGIFVDAQGLNCTRLEIVRAKKYLTQIFLKR